MIITSANSVARAAMWEFLQQNGVRVHRSEDFQAIGRENSKGEIIGVVGFNGFAGKIAQIHIAGVGNWVSREFIQHAFHYPFVQLKLNHLVGLVGAKNDKALRFDQKMGFSKWFTIPDGYDDGEDMIVLKMSRAECRWLKGEVA